MTTQSQLPTGGFTKPDRFAMIELEKSPKRTNTESKAPVQLLIDVTISEDHHFEADVTDYPVESGGTISDNIRHKPITVQIEGIVSNTPLNQMLVARGQDALNDADEISTAAQGALGFLMYVWLVRETVTLRTSLGTFKKMALSSLTFPRSKDTGDALKFNAKFQQIVEVSNGRVVAGGGTRGAGGPTQKLGTQASFVFDQGLVYWRKGIAFTGADGGVFYQGGSLIIRETEVVYWKRERLSTSEVSDVNTVTNGNWFHTDQKTPLSAEEIVRLKLDLARDRRQRQGDRALGPGYVDSSGQFNKVYTEKTASKRKVEPVDLNKAAKEKPNTKQLPRPTRTEFAR